MGTTCPDLGGGVLGKFGLGTFEGVDCGQKNVFLAVNKCICFLLKMDYDSYLYQSHRETVSRSIQFDLCIYITLSKDLYLVRFLK